MNDVVNKLEAIRDKFDEKTQKKLRVQVFINLCNKLNEESDLNIQMKINQSLDLLYALSQDSTIKKREYRKSFSSLQKEVRNKYGYTAKGQIKEEYTGFGIAIGVALGAPFSAINPAFIGIGLPIGLAIGVAVGEKKEKEAEEKGNVY